MTTPGTLPAMDAGPRRLPGSVSDRVADVIRAAEDAAAGIESDARETADSMIAEAERALSEARAEADQILAGARAERAQIIDASTADAEQATQRAWAQLERLLTQADELRTRVGSLGTSLADEVRARVTEITAGDPVPAGARPAPPDQLSDAPGNPSRGGPDDDAGSLRDARSEGVDLRGRISSSGFDLGAARVVATNMAMEGADRATIAARLAEEFNDLDDRDSLIDAALQRASWT